MTASAKQVTSRVKETGRAVEDSAEPIQDALAERDSWGDEADETTQEHRLKLASRSLDATRKSPYTQIFSRGLDYYITAPLGEHVTRYKELISRIEAHLPKDDDLRGPTVDALTASIEGFELAAAKVAKTRADRSLARTDLETAEDEWDIVMEKIFGRLVTDFGRKKANRFFPRAKRGRSAEENIEADEAKRSK